MNKKATSYLDEIGACREAVGYDQEQVGKGHEEEVAAANNWEDDKRDPVGRAATIANRKKRLAKKLMRISRELEALGKMEENYMLGVEELSDDDDYDYEEKADKMDYEEKADDMDYEEKADKGDKDDYDYEEKAEENDEEKAEIGEPGFDEKDPMAMTMGTDEWLDPAGKEAAHPIEHGEDKVEFSPSTMGDDEWISIGPGTFSDPRDAVGRAA